jgi:two-component system, NtrC family, response regulator HydG
MNKTKIIVVEDNIVYCEYVCNMLSREGYRNMKAYHLSTAKKHLQQATDNDIVVADLRLHFLFCFSYQLFQHDGFIAIGQ